MTYKEVQNLFKNLQGKKQRLETLLVYINGRRSLMDGVGAVNYDKVSVESSHSNNTEERYVKEMDRLKDLQKHYDLLYDDFCKDEELAFNLMRKLSPTEYEVILHRFLEGLSRYKTATLMNYSEDNIKYLQREAIKKMSKS